MDTEKRKGGLRRLRPVKPLMFSHGQRLPWTQQSSLVLKTATASHSTCSIACPALKSSICVLQDKCRLAANPLVPDDYDGSTWIAKLNREKAMVAGLALTQASTPDAKPAHCLVNRIEQCCLRSYHMYGV
jgi:hypothetical protein